MSNRQDSINNHLKFILLFIVLFILVALCNIAFAVGTSANIKWTLATEYIDGTPLNIADIKETLIEWRRPSKPAVVGSTRVTAPAIQTTVNGLVCGDFDFVAYTVMKVTAESSASTLPVNYKTQVTCTANPPGGPTVQ